jgi:hypothetical protein
MNLTTRVEVTIGRYLFDMDVTYWYEPLDQGYDPIITPGRITTIYAVVTPDTSMLMGWMKQRGYYEIALDYINRMLNKDYIYYPGCPLWYMLAEYANA